ncbi:hypothetical protein Hanom_Chr01g00053991 [Helianthus anomalus]
MQRPYPCLCYESIKEPSLTHFLIHPLNTHTQLVHSLSPVTVHGGAAAAARWRSGCRSLACGGTYPPKLNRLNPFPASIFLFEQRGR